MKLLLLFLSAGVFAQNVTNVDNEKVKVLTVVQGAGVKSKLHEHAVNRIMIHLNAGGQTLRYADGRVENQKWKAGGIDWSPAGGKHTSENPSTVANTIVEVELKQPAPARPAAFSPLDPVKLAPASYQVELENAQVRVLRVKIGPHQSVPLHEHGLPRVVVYMTDQDFKVTEADGKEELSKHKAGDVTFSGVAKHKEQNMSSRPFEVIVVELK